MDPQIVWMIGIGLAAIVLLISLYVWRGVWLVQHKGRKYAEMRWKAYVRTERTVRHARAMVYRSQSVTLEVQPVTLEMAIHAYNRQRKNKRRRVEEQVRQVETPPVVLEVQDVVIIPRLPNLQPAFIEVEHG